MYFNRCTYFGIYDKGCNIRHFDGGILGGTITALRGISFWEGFEDGVVSAGGASLISDFGDILIKGENISFGQVIFNIGFSAILGALFAGAFHGLAKSFRALSLNFSKGTSTNRGPVEFATPKDNMNARTIAQTKAYVKGCNKALKAGVLSSTGRVSTQA
ncbi:hypothetical protein [Acetivibrio clariflavus]|uniref:hypothetical protein n=1 Tax=Acetivibrio clariflavus TaxID=288965 RepID=UPI0011A8082A|nr:hypothetical protein [Acetivibrio clariflavus]